MVKLVKIHFCQQIKTNPELLVGPPPEMENIEQHQKIPLTAYGRPGTFSVMMTLIRYIIKIF